MKVAVQFIFADAGTWKFFEVFILEFNLSKEVFEKAEITLTIKYKNSYWKSLNDVVLTK